MSIQPEIEDLTNLLEPFLSEDMVIAATAHVQPPSSATLAEADCFQETPDFIGSYEIDVESFIKELELDPKLPLDWGSFLETIDMDHLPLGDILVTEDAEAEKNGEKENENVDDGSPPPASPEIPIRLTAKRRQRKCPETQKEAATSFGKEFLSSPGFGDAEVHSSSVSKSRTSASKRKRDGNAGRRPTKLHKCEVETCTKTFARKKDCDRHSKDHYFDLHPDSFILY